MIEHKAAARNCGARKVHLKNETVAAGTRLAFPTGSRMQQPLLGWSFPGGGSSVLRSENAALVSSRAWSWSVTVPFFPCWWLELLLNTPLNWPGGSAELPAASALCTLCPSVCFESMCCHTLEYRALLGQLYFNKIVKVQLLFPGL